MVRVGDGPFTLRGHSQGVEWLGGSDFDQAIFSRVQDATGLKGLGTTDQDLLASLRRLRRDCTDAKELLSVDTEATLTVGPVGRRSRIRLVRSEFEELIRDAIDDTVDTTHRAIISAGMTEQDIDAIVLTGGSSRIPLVAQVISAEFSLPIVVDATPEASTSLGAAWHARAALQARSAAAEVSEELPAAVAVAVTAVDAQPVEEASTPIPTAIVPVTSPTPPPAQPAPVPGGSVGPAGRRDQLARHGRHRRKGIRRYWMQVVGILAAVAVIISAGSALATSQASDRNSPGGSPQANGVNISTTSPALPSGTRTVEGLRPLGEIVTLTPIIRSGRVRGPAVGPVEVDDRPVEVEDQGQSGGPHDRAEQRPAATTSGRRPRRTSPGRHARHPRRARTMVHGRLAHAAEAGRRSPRTGPAPRRGGRRSRGRRARPSGPRGRAQAIVARNVSTPP